MEKNTEFRRGIFTACKRSLGQGNIFKSVCQEFCPQAGGVCWGGACSGGAWSGGFLLRVVPGGDPPGTATAAGGTHPTGMHSC